MYAKYVSLFFFFFFFDFFVKNESDLHYCSLEDQMSWCQKAWALNSFPQQLPLYGLDTVQ